MKTLKINLLLAVILGLFQNTLWAADGAGLFKSRCNTCHMIDKNSTGPKLQGVKQKWTAAGEGGKSLQMGAKLNRINWFRKKCAC